MTGLFLAQMDIADKEMITETVDEAVEKTNILMDMLKGFAKEHLFPFCTTLLVALVVYLIGKKLIRFCMKLIDKSFARAEMEVSAANFLSSLIKTALYVLLVFIIAGILGVGTSSIVAIVGSCGLAIGLALQGSLSNFAGGVLLLLLKPFVVGDYIIAAGHEGKVVSIDIIYTRLLTVDNRSVVIPNGTLSNSEIINVTAEDKRRLDMDVSIDYEENITRVREVLLSVLASQEKILEQDEVSVFVANFDSSAVRMGIRVWVKTEDYFEVKFSLYEKIKQKFDEENISIPYDQLDVNIRK